MPDRGELLRLSGFDQTVDKGGGCECVFLQGQPPASVALMAREGVAPLALVIWGDYPERQRSGAFLRSALRLLDRMLATGQDLEWIAKRGSDELAGIEPYRGLRFPDAYRPGTSPPMRDLYERMRPLLRGELPVLISGETGVGKELVARLLHRSSERRHGPFVAVNCAAIPSEMLEAEMFGIAKGVATGVDARRGKFEMAEGGSLFLDEIGELSPGLQAKLLRALQEKEIHPVGGDARRVDVRVVSATNVDLDSQIEGGAMRADLFYRLAGVVLEVPPLRHCPEDIPGLVEHFLRRFTAESGNRPRGITVAALRRLTSHGWPGNVRELEHEIRRLVYASGNGQVIRSEQLGKRLSGEGRGANPLSRFVSGLDSLKLGPVVSTLEDLLVREALERCQGNKLKASQVLGLSRTGLYKKLRRLESSAEG